MGGSDEKTLIESKLNRLIQEFAEFREDSKKQWKQMDQKRRKQKERSSNTEENLVLKNNPTLYAAKSKYEPHFYMVVHDIKRSASVGKYLVERGAWEPHLSNILVKAAKEESDYNGLIDIGGNVGWFSLLAASQGQQVWTFEPLDYNRELIQMSMRMNPTFSNLIHLMKSAVALDQVTYPKKRYCVEASYVASLNAGNGQIKKDKEQCSGQLVPAITVDNELLNHFETIPTKPLALKVDIEGYELIALQGAKGILKDYSPCLIFTEVEHIDVIGKKPEDMHQFLSQFGYKICKKFRHDVAYVNKDCPLEEVVCT